MSENLFSAVLTLSLLAGGTIAFGGDLARPMQASAVATLPAVTVTGKRIAAADAVLLPTVVVTGTRCLPTELAADTTTVEHRVQ